MQTRSPPCPHAQFCGGCQIQHLSYESQIEQKTAQVHTLFSSFFPDQSLPLQVFTGDEFGYRNRMDFVFGARGLGLREAKHWQSVVPIATCHIAHPSIQAMFSQVKEAFNSVDYFDPKKKSGTFRYATLRVADTTSCTFILNADSMKIADAYDKITEFANHARIDNILVGYVPSNEDESTASELVVIKGSETLTQTLGQVPYTFSSQGFFQNNTPMAQKMVDYVVEKVKGYEKTGKANHLLDYYGGVGTFGIACAPYAKQVTIVESYAPAIEQAKLNAKQFTHVQAFALDAAKIAKLSIRPDCVIADPPRSGMDAKALTFLSTCGAKRIIYISCNPSQLRRELAWFSSYTCTSIALFDLFPQTTHMEVVLELVRKEYKP